MANYSYEVADVILGIEAEMRRARVWEERAPGASALDSPLPFCCDTLSVTQWLQWIFVPRTKQILEHSYPLPERSEIHPYADECLQQASWATERLLALLKRFDDIISAAQSGRERH